MAAYGIPLTGEKVLAGRTKEAGGGVCFNNAIPTSIDNIDMGDSMRP